jgi:hypothetical protein
MVRIEDDANAVDQLVLPQQEPPGAHGGPKAAGGR